MAPLIPLLFERLSQFVEARTGLHFPPARFGDLQRGIDSAADEFGFAESERCIEWLLATPLSPEQIATLGAHLTIGETYFFRDKQLFELLLTTILPEIIEARRGKEQQLRIWSAGCSTGEEPYSLAILLARLLPDLPDWNITILATDISPHCLQKASEGLYGEWSFRDTPGWVKERWFEKRGRNFAIAPGVQRLVSFFPLNLAADVYPAIINRTSAMDIIFCRNVLMYFTKERAIAVIDNLARCLVDDGWLVTGPAEVHGPKLSPILQPVMLPGAVLYRRGEKARCDVRPQIASPPASPAERKISGRGKPKPIPTGSRAPRQDRVSPPLPIESPDSLQLADQARLLADQGQLTLALAACAEAIRADKLNPALPCLQATILQEMNRPEEALAAFKRAIYIDQECTIAHFALGHLLQQQGKYKEAAKYLAKARTLLQSGGHDEILPEAGGMSTGRLLELIHEMRRPMV